MRVNSLAALSFGVVCVSTAFAIGVRTAPMGTERPGGEPGSTASVPAPSVPEPPFSFERNVGQADGRVAYLARGRGFGLFLSGNEAVLALHGTERSELLRMRVMDGEPRDITGLDGLRSRSNYFIGNDPRAWHTNVPHFRRVRHESIYPGIDLIYYGRQGRLEYDFVVAPGSDPRKIRLAFDGAKALRVNPEGGLTIEMAGRCFSTRRSSTRKELTDAKGWQVGTSSINPTR